MASQNVKQRIKDEPPHSTTTTTNNNNNDDNKSRKAKKMAMAKRGLRSLTIAVAVPLSLTVATIYLFGSSRDYHALTKPPLWALHLASLVSSFLMGLSAWLVWAEGGFHRQPIALPLYLAQLALALSWDPLVFPLGATWAGLAVCVALFGALVGCSQIFRKVNPIAGDLVKPCLAWVALLTIINYQILYP